MILTCSPLRITLGGGGTDLPSYYSKYGGFVVTAAIDKFVYLVTKSHFDDTIRVTYSKSEVVDSIEEIEHERVREALRLLDISHGVEIVSIADVPAHTGLGSSSTFTTAMLKGLHAYKGEAISADQLAEEACALEIDILGEPVGKQDQYISAHGGLICMEIDQDGRVDVTPLDISPDSLAVLQSNTMVFYTGVRRSASKVLTVQDTAARKNDGTVTANLHRIKEIGYEVKRALESGDLRTYGKLMDVHWQLKRGLSSGVTLDRVDELYDKVRDRGALGGKLIGAGGGGFLMFYSEDNHEGIRTLMEAEGLREMKFRFDSPGCRIITDLSGR